MTPDPHKPLRDDVRLLGELLGDTLKADAGEDVLRTVERVRGLAEVGARRQRPRRSPRSPTCSRACRSTRRCRSRARSRSFCIWPTSPSSIIVSAGAAPTSAIPPRRRSEDRARTASRVCSAAGITPDRLHEAVCALQIELVLTAHPTEVARRRIVQKHNRIARALAARDRPDLTTHRARRAGRVAPPRDRKRLGDERGARAASVADRRGAQRSHRLRAEPVGRGASLRTGAGPRAAREHRAADCRSTRRRFASARGSAAIATAIRMSRHTSRAARAGCRGGPRPICISTRSTRSATSSRSMTPRRNSSSAQAVRASRTASCCAMVRGRMRATRDWIETTLQGDEDVPVAPDVYLDSADLMADLRLCHRSLEATGHALIAAGRLTDLLRRVSVFDVTLARIDIRQDSARHTEALSAITVGAGSRLLWRMGRADAARVPASRARGATAAHSARIWTRRRRFATCSTPSR